MRRLTLLGLLAWLGLLSMAAAQGHADRSDAGLPPPPLPPHPLPHYPALPPQPVTLPADAPASSNWEYVAPAAANPTAKDCPTDRIQHLRQAADHLEAAGLKEQATTLRRQAAELDSLLAEKLKQLKELQSEIDRLTKARPVMNAAHVQLKLQIVQVSRQKLPAGDDAAALIGKVVNPPPERIASQGNTCFAMAVQPRRAVENALTKLCQAGAIEVLAEPVLLTTSGREAFFCMGEERPVIVPAGKDQLAVEFKKAGIQLYVLPVLCDGTHVRLEVRPRITTWDAARSIKIGDHSVQGMRTRELDAGVVVPLGETLLVGYLAQPPATSKDAPQASTVADEKPEQDIVILVTPTLLETGVAPSMPHGPTAERTHDSWWDRLWRK